VLRAFDERSMRAGTDAGVVGFDDSAAAQVTGLSSVRQPLEQVAVELVGLLRAALDGVPTPASGTVLTPRLVVRGSSLRR
jgi:LacI family transcriptional regulator